MISADTASVPNQESTAGGITPALLGRLKESFSMDERDRACHNAVTNNPINALALNRDILRKDDGHFSHRIKSKGITNQERSGRCWMFAALNVLRPQVIRDYRMAEFEFSTAYLQFWDKLEKANLFLESVIELRDADYLDREWEIVTKWTLGDGGWWNYAAGLIEKYGVVPRSVMPETHSSTHTDTLNEILGRLVRARGAALLDRHTAGDSPEELRSLKDEALGEIYRILVLNLGEPPVEFDWRYRHTRKPDTENPDSEMEKVREADLTGLEHHTPKSFADKYIGHPLDDFVCLYNDPKNELDRHYRLERANNIAGGECMHFINIGMPAMMVHRAVYGDAADFKLFMDNMLLSITRKVFVEQSLQHLVDTPLLPLLTSYKTQ